MEELKDRVSYIRKLNEMTQEDFGKEINLSKNYVWMLESGKRAPGARTITDICQRFGVSEHWLLTGEGEMQAPKTKEAEIAEITAQLFKKSQVDEQTYSFIMKLNEILVDLNESQMKLVFDAIRKLNAAISEPEEKKE